MNDIFNTLEQHGTRLALITESGEQLNYLDVCRLADGRASELRVPDGYIWFEIDGSSESILSFIGACRKGWPALLIEPGSSQKYEALLKQYPPAYIFCTKENQYKFLPQTAKSFKVHPELAVLLSTSGSTGSSKLVRLSNNNLISNAHAIADYLEINDSDRAIMTLPLFYSYGLSVLNSHLLSGAAIIVNSASVTEDVFWKKITKFHATSFAGVPRTYELLAQGSFLKSTLSSLRYFTVAGGRLSSSLVRQFSEYALRNNQKFYVMYGQTEASPRISYLPSEAVLENTDCIGKAIPGGKLYIVDDAGSEIKEINKPGILCYEGPNVMMGYASKIQDLAKGFELDRLQTGDLAVISESGFYRIIGHQKRFVKINGARISLDQVERMLHDAGFQSVAVSGNDIRIAVACISQNAKQKIRDYLCDTLKLIPDVVIVMLFSDIPTLPNGKNDYQRISDESDKIAASNSDTLSIREKLASILRVELLKDDDTFIDAGGDSLNLVEGSMAIEGIFKHPVNGWESMTMKQLESMLESGHIETKSTDMVVVARSIAIILSLASHFFISFRVWEDLGDHVRLLTRLALPTFLILTGMLLSRNMTHQSGNNSVNFSYHTDRYIPRAFTLFSLFVLVEVCALVGEHVTITKVLGSLVLVNKGRFGSILIVYGFLYLLLPFVLYYLVRKEIIAVFSTLLLVWGLWIIGTILNIDLGYFGDLLFGFGNERGPSILQGLTFVIFGYVLGRNHSGFKFRFATAALIFLSSLILIRYIYISGLDDLITGIGASAKFRSNNHPVYYSYGILGVFVVFGFSWLLNRIPSIQNGTSMFLSLGRNSIFAYTFGNIILNLLHRDDFNLVGGLVVCFIFLSFVTIVTADIYSNNPRFIKRLSRGYHEFANHWNKRVINMFGIKGGVIPCLQV